LLFDRLEWQSQQRVLNLVWSKRAIKLGQPLSDAMINYWTNFAKTGNPNGAGLPAWPEYNRKEKPRMYLDVEVASAPLTQNEIERYNFFAGREQNQMIAFYKRWLLKLITR